MANEPSSARRFPVGLTFATVIALGILISLGVWQVQRLAWKEALLARIARLEAAPAQSAPGALERAASPLDLDMVRVRLDCPGLGGADFVELYALKGGQPGRRLISACPLGSGRFESVLVDRGFIADTVSARPASSGEAGPETVTGIFRVPDRAGPFTPKANSASRLWFARDIPAMAAALGAVRPAPVMLFAETSSNPGFGALVPAPIPATISNRHLEYALTWFGLAAALLGVYGALLRKHFRS
ncbi:MAG: SURF1 family protein [Phenylobacterium sp.]